MKKKIFILSSIMMITSLSLLLSIKSNKLASIVDVSLADIESLANPEGGGDHSWLQPKTVACKLDLGGGWFTGSVRRDCEFCAVPYSCTTVECGGSF